MNTLNYWQKRAWNKSSKFLVKTKNVYFFQFVQKYKFTKSLSRYILKIYNIYNFACADVSCEEDF